MIVPPPNPNAAVARAEMQAYQLPMLANPPAHAMLRTVPLWPLGRARRWRVEAHDDGCELWVDDAASVLCVAEKGGMK